MLTLVGYIADYHNLNYPLKAMDMHKELYTIKGPLINYEEVLDKGFEVLLFDCYWNNTFIGKYSSRVVINNNDTIPSNYIRIKTLDNKVFMLRKHLFLID